MDLVKPTMRAAVEEQLNLIAHGKADFNAVLGHTIDTFTAKFKYFVEHVQAMDELFEVSFSPLASSGRPISRYCQHTHWFSHYYHLPLIFLFNTINEINFYISVFLFC